ncbi:NACHT domain-containing protein [Bernardetia sp.]|uniref:NACHT domain-containing protein n=1 Tax=Bernardetia sp. TaxID=1937974 RepID=UPI0025BEAFEE|nr:NACHT domain-containing protein [Bernardetia sp.]
MNPHDNQNKRMNLSYLHTPNQTIIDPPIETTVQELPLEKLAWEDFEKLCLAVVQIDFSINDCEIYGTKGQAQEGIDIFARQANGKYSAYQCKRYQKFDLSNINNAVQYFKKKSFYSKSESLYLCTSCEWNKTQVQDRFEELKTELEKENLTLIKWDKIQLSRLLKTKPQIVFDFFGLEWVKKFNGELALQKLSKSKKFDAGEIAKFRKELYEFYSTIFNIQDPGIPIKELNSPYNLQDRFIVPDILTNIKEEGFESYKENPLLTTNHEQYYHYDYFQSENEVRRRHWDIHNDVEDSSIDVRVKIDDVLANNNRNIVIGDPGAGKSTLLRYISLDILSSNPELENISQKYGQALPVWLPFAFITKHLSQNDSLGILEILNLWFKSFGKNHLFNITKEALEDERLFLVIDGIDEWSSISSAHQAIMRIETIRELYNCKILYSSRPYGFRMLKENFTNLNILNLAGFSKIQQRDFIEKWYTKWTSLQDDTQDKDYSRTLTDNFVKELEQAGDLKKLAETPLLLSILIVQKMQDSVLPKNKLEALKEITQYLIKKHPTKRLTGAGIVQEKTNDIDFKDIFCELAIFIQRESNDGVILKSEAQKTIEKYLIEYAGYDKAKSKVRSEELIEVGANNFGIIIEKSNDEISFGHKQFQEFLAAQYLYDSDEDDVKGFITQHAANPTFHQVIVNLFGLMQVKQRKKYTTYFEALKRAVCENYQKDYLKLISYEVVIDLDNAPNEIVNSSFSSIISDFEYETDPLYKEALLRRLLNALQNGKLKEKAQKFLLQYFPNQNKYADTRIYALRKVERLSDLQLDFLKKGFINGKMQLRYDASYTFQRHIKDNRVFSFLKDIILNCSNPDILAFAINGIISDDIEEQERDKLLNSIDIKVSIVQLYLYKHKIFSKKHSQEDLQSILQVINQIPYQLGKEAIKLLIDGFNDNNFLKEVLLDSVRRNSSYRENQISIDRGIAWNVLFHSFNKDLDVINTLKSEFENYEYSFSFDEYEMFQHLDYYFNDNEILIPVVEKWLNKDFPKYNYISPEAAFASIFVHTENIKKRLLQKLPKIRTAPHWNVKALLDGWKGDKKIIEKLKKYFRTIDKNTASYSAHLIYRVFDSSEKEEAIKLLEEILFDKQVIHRERAIDSLIRIDKRYFETNILEKLIDEFDSLSKDIWNQYYYALDVVIEHFHSNETVRRYILERIENDNSLYVISLQYFPELISNEDKLLKQSIPLSVEFRLLIIESFTDLSILPKEVERVLSEFGAEKEEEVMADMAVCLFNHIKKSNVNKIIDLSKPLVFARGFDYKIKRSIAFSGYLISEKLGDYFDVEDIESNSKNKSRHLDIFNYYTYRASSSRIMIKSLIDNFDYLVSSTDKDLNVIIENLKLKKDAEYVWGFFARYSTRSSPTYSYIMDFISNNAATIRNNSIISFLNRTNPKSPILKEILLRFINDSDKRNRILAGRLLGINFKNDNQVYEEVKKVRDSWDSGRIIALCNGWSDEPILKKMFDELVESQISVDVDNYVGFNLKFLFRDVDNLIDFLKNISVNAGDIKEYHKFFFIPMIERLRRDKNFGLAIKELLLSSTSINERISYYNLLSQANMIDEDITSWKNKITDFKNDFGYDIVSNKTVRLKDILHDYYY